MTPSIRPYPSTSSAFFHIQSFFPIHQTVSCALPGLSFMEEKIYVCECVYMCVCILGNITIINMLYT